MFEFKYNWLFPIIVRATRGDETREKILTKLDDLAALLGTTCILCIADFCKDLVKNNGCLKHTIDAPDGKYEIEIISKGYENAKKKEEK